MPARSKKHDLWDQVVEMSETHSQAEIGAALGVHPFTISKWCREEGFDWPAKKGGRERGERVLKPCKQCGKEMDLQPSQAKFREFCSRDCTNEWQRTGREAQKVTLTCPCGKEFRVDPSSVSRPAESQNRKFCSKTCANQYQVKRQPDPANYVTFDCGTCGKSVTRPRDYGSSISGKQFCSNACAAKHTKVVKHYVVRETDMVLDSTWEMLFAGLCGFLKIPIERYDRKRGVEWTATGLWYAPDFWMPTLGLAVEVKGLEDDDDPEKWRTYRRERGALAVLSQSKLEALRGASAEDVQWGLQGVAYVQNV